MCDIFPFMSCLFPEKACQPHGFPRSDALWEPHCPLEAISSDTQPLIVLATSYDISQPYLAPLNWLLCLGSERSRYIPNASKAAKPMCSIGDLAYRPDRSTLVLLVSGKSRLAGEQTGQNIPIQYLRKNTIAQI